MVIRAISMGERYGHDRTLYKDIHVTFQKEINNLLRTLLISVQ